MERWLSESKAHRTMKVQIILLGGMDISLYCVYISLAFYLYLSFPNFWAQQIAPDWIALVWPSEERHGRYPPIFYPRTELKQKQLYRPGKSLYYRRHFSDTLVSKWFTLAKRATRKEDSTKVLVLKVWISSQDDWSVQILTLVGLTSCLPKCFGYSLKSLHSLYGYHGAPVRLNAT